jgi:hypothetical protein
MQLSTVVPSFVSRTRLAHRRPFGLWHVFQLHVREHRQLGGKDRVPQRLQVQDIVHEDEVALLVVQHVMDGGPQLVVQQSQSLGNKQNSLEF